MTRYLIIQTAFIGDVILATALIESIYEYDNSAKIDFLVRKGNESLISGHPKLNEVLIWNKKDKKYSNLKDLAKKIKKTQYDVLINLQRFGSTGYLCWRSKAKKIIGFDKNPFSFCYTHKVEHKVGNGKHEVERNHGLLKPLGDFPESPPKLYPSENDLLKIEHYNLKDYYVLAPTSVWFTKQMPAKKWVELINQIPATFKVILIGAANDRLSIDQIIKQSRRTDCENMAGEMSLLQSAALMKNAKRTFVNDSAPLHLASSVNAAVTAFFCSTIPAFGFGPLSADQKIIQTSENLSCRPCGLHGKSSCPETHFDCGHKISVTID